VADQSAHNNGGPHAGQSFNGRPYAGGPAVQESLPGNRWNGNRNPDGRIETFDPHRASTGELVTQAAGQISTLVRSELALGKSELIAKVRSLGLGGALLATAAVFSPFALALFFALVIVLLDMVWPLWLAVLVPLLAVGALILGLAGMGIMKLRRGGRPMPTEAASSLRDDIKSVRQAIHEGRH
jgi:hypothetical protein